MSRRYSMNCTNPDDAKGLQSGTPGEQIREREPRNRSRPSQSRMENMPLRDFSIVEAISPKVSVHLLPCKVVLLSKMNCIAMSAAYSPSLHPRCAPIGAEPRPKLNLLNEVTVKAAPSMTQAACGSGHSLERVPRHANGYPASAAPIARQNQHSILSAEAKSPFFTFTTWPTLRGGGGS